MNADYQPYNFLPAPTLTLSQGLMPNDANHDGVLRMYPNIRARLPDTKALHKPQITHRMQV